jgi:glucan 1,3-beta-glucosidase
MSIYQRVIGSSNVNLYSSGFWNFVAGPSRTMCSTDCQDNAVMYEDNSKLYSFGVSTINNKNMVLEPTSGSGTSKYAVVVARATNNAGVKDIFQTAVMAAYIRQSA